MNTTPTPTQVFLKRRKLKALVKLLEDLNPNQSGEAMRAGYGKALIKLAMQPTHKVQVQGSVTIAKHRKQLRAIRFSDNVRYWILN